MRGTRVWAGLLRLQRTVVERVWIGDEGEVIVAVRAKRQDAPGGATRMSLRNRGEPAGFAKVAAPAMAAAMRRANRKDLERLKAVLEAAA